MKSRLHSFNMQHGVAIIEAMIAILIFSIGILGIVGMQASMLKNTAESQYRSEANYMAQQLVGAMWADSQPVANLDNFIVTSTFPVKLPNGDTLSSSLPKGKIAISKIAVTSDTAGTVNGGIFTITVGWTAPGEIPYDNAAPPCFMAVAHCFSTTATISGS